MTRVIADLPRRVIAYVVDVAFLLLAQLAAVSVALLTDKIGSVAMVAPFVVGAFVIWAFVFTLLQGLGGSVGMRVFGLRLSDPRTQGPIGVLRALWRNVVWFALCGVLIGYITVFFDRTGRRQGWHDRAAHAVVTRRGQRTRVMVDLPSRDVHAAEWLAAMSVPQIVTDTVSEVTSGGPDEQTDAPLINEVPGITADRIEAQRLRELAGLRAAATLVWDDGSQFRVYTRTVFGRNPVALGGAQLAAVTDDTMSLSKTHFEVTRLTTGGATITDLHSTNGVALRRHGQVEELPPGRAMPLRSGDIIEIAARRARVEVTA